jgi:ABC-type multidrug transport system fused ATPase/permease subunit
LKNLNIFFFFKSAASSNMGNVIKSIFNMIGNIYILFSMSWELSIIILIYVPAFVFFSSYLGRN